MINILFTSAGRRVELVQEFIRARKLKKIDGNIICGDMSDLAPSLYFADKAYILPSIMDSNYIPKLLHICQKEKVDLVIPTIDTELKILAENIGKFKELGSDVLISSLRVINISRNKLETFRFFNSIGLKTPRSYGPGMDYTDYFPCFIKPISGSSSINAFKVQNKKELEFFKYYIGDYIIQEFISGEEYTIDVMCDFDGEPIYVTPRIRLATRSGEVLKTRIHHDKKLIELVMLIIESLKPKGPLTIQAIKSKTDGEYYFIEINARFGGGAPLSIKAGADSAAALYDLLLGKRLVYMPSAAQDGMIFLRFDQSISLKKMEDGRYEKC